MPEARGSAVFTLTGAAGLQAEAMNESDSLLSDTSGKFGAIGVVNRSSLPCRTIRVVPESNLPRASHRSIWHRMPWYWSIAVVGLVLSAVVLGMVCGHYLWPHGPHAKSALVALPKYQDPNAQSWPNVDAAWQALRGTVWPAPQVGALSRPHTPQHNGVAGNVAGTFGITGHAAGGQPAGVLTQVDTAHSVPSGPWATTVAGSQDAQTAWQSGRWSRPQAGIMAHPDDLELTGAASAGTGTESANAGKDSGALTARYKRVWLTPSEVAVSRMDGRIDTRSPPPLDVFSEDELDGGGGIGLEVLACCLTLADPDMAQSACASHVTSQEVSTMALPHKKLHMAMPS